jgi:hypothetical protein
MRYGQNLKLGDAHVTPRNIQELQASKLGDAPRHSSLLVFFCWNKWLDPNKLLLDKTHSIFHCQEHSSFHSYRSTIILFFKYCIFCLDFCSDFVLSLYKGEFRPLVYIGFHLKKLFQKGLNGVGKEKKVL